MPQKITFVKFLIFFALIIALPSCAEERERKDYERTEDSQLISYETSLNTSSVKLLTWNIQDLGRTKDDKEILQIAKIIKNFDMIAIQEVVAKDPRGAQVVAQIVDNLNS